MSGTIYPDLESLLVAKLKALFTASNLSITNNVTISTKKPPSDVNPYPTKIVTVRADGGPDLERNIMREEAIGVNIYASTYKNANDLALVTDAFMRQINGSGIQLIENLLSPVRVDNPKDDEEQRFMTYSVVLKATDL
jgi:hypothetical protein